MEIGAAHGASRAAGDASEVLAGGGELGARMREIDWSRTSLGPVDAWPQSLKTCVRIVLTSRQPMFVWWGDELINLYNDAYKSIVGGKHPNALGRPASEVWREIWDQVGPRAAAAMSGNEGTYDEALLLIMERNGYPEETYYTFSYSPVPNDQGGTGGLICANTDDTQRIVGERQIGLLREQAARTAHVRTVDEACRQAALALESNPRDIPFALLYVADADRRTLRLAALTGLARGTVAAPEDVQLAASCVWPLARVLEERASRVVELDGTFGDLPIGPWPRPASRAVVLPILPAGDQGRAAVLVVGLNPYRLYDAGYEGFLGLVVSQLAASISNAQAAEEEKRRLEALAELDRAKTTFFSNVSHEFRTPLTLMIGPLEDALSSPERALSGESLERTHRNALRLLKLVNALLDFSRIEAGRVQAAYESVDIAAFTSELASVFRSAMDRAGLRFDVDVRPVLAPVYVDRDMWEKIVLNLLSNAFKFTLEGEVGVRVREEGAHVVLTVTDTGAGVSASELPHLFERFHRVRGVRARTHEGSGIGLALLQELVKLHGGDVRVQSTEGKGTRFEVRIPTGHAHLPREKVAATERAGTRGVAGASPFVEEALRWLPLSSAPGGAAVAASSSDTRLPAVAESRRRRIVLADDNADMREYVARLLSPFWDVEAVADGVAALDAACREPPAVVVSDVMMPNLDGFGLLRELRADARTRTTPVVLLSARAGEDATAEGLTSGANDYLVKPFSARELIARVSAQIAIAEIREEAQRAKEAERKIIETLFNEAPSPITLIRGPDLIIEFANPACIALWQRKSVDDVLGKPLLDAIPETRGRGFDALLRQVIATGKPFHGNEVPSTFRREDGEPVLLNFVYAPSANARGEIDGVSVFAHDVTPQVKARERAELGAHVGRALASEQKLDAQLRDCCEALVHLGALSASLWTHDPSQGVLERRAAAGERHDTDDVKTRVPVATSALGDVVQTRTVSFGERTTAADGARSAFAASLPLTVGDRVVGVLSLSARSILSDDWRATLATTADQIALAIDRDAGERFRELFIGMLGHDLRNPLNAILMATLLLSSSATDPQKRTLSKVESSARRMERMVRQVLDFTRARSGGGIPLTRVSSDLVPVCEQTIDELRTAHRNRTIDWTVSGDARGSWDPDRMAQVFSNLLSNALSYGDPARPVVAAMSGGDDEVVFRVHNHGAPIPPALLTKLFDPFRRATQAKEVATQGLGLGLFITDQIVRAHGGTIHVESTAERGTLFAVSLPRRGASW